MATPPLHVSGRYLQDPSGNSVLLHGWMQPADSWFNGEGHNFKNPTDYTDPANVAPALNFYKGAVDIFSSTDPQYGYDHGWDASFVRFIADGNGVSNFAPGWDVNGNLANAAQFNGWIDNVLVPYVNYCASKGLYVVLCGNPSVAYPGGDVAKNMTQQYQSNLKVFWETVAGNAAIKNAPNVMFEICNEPIKIETAFGANDWGSGNAAHWAALTNFMQPIVTAIRDTGANNVIWVPGLGYQGEYQGFATSPVTGLNIGYAGHFYPAYGNVHDNYAGVQKLWDTNYKPAADLAPFIITECYWYPNNGNGYIDLFNGNTQGFGNAAKAAFDGEGNVSFLIGMIGDLLANINSGLASTTLNAQTNAGAPASFSWWVTYYTPKPGRLINLSARTLAGTGSQTLIAGFVISGSGSKTVMVRGSGPTLANFGLSGLLADPRVDLYEDQSIVASNDSWASAPNLADIKAVNGALMGQYPFDPKDAVLLTSLSARDYTAHVVGSDGGTGLALVEVFDEDIGEPGDATFATQPRLINLSARTQVGTGANILIAGFVINGNVPRKIMIRGIGPALKNLGVTGVLADPLLKLYDSTGAVIAQNDSWRQATNLSDITTANGQVLGPYPLDDKDAVLVVTLAPGSYTAQVSGVSGATGVALVEVDDFAALFGQ
jgi:hypothetical protein